MPPVPVYRVYLDTFVFGGCFDPGFEEDSRRVLDAVRAGRLVALVSETVIAEVKRAPERVREQLASLPVSSLEEVLLAPEVVRLQQAYLSAGILSPQRADDAMHVAAATVSRSDAIVSWNFRHIVRLDKIKAYNEVNLRMGYDELTILSPREVRIDDDEGE